MHPQKSLCPPRDPLVTPLTIGDVEKSRELVELAAKHFPHLTIAVNASDRSSAYKIMDLGITHIRRETFGSALELGQDALQILGFDPYEAHRLRLIFLKNDEEMMPDSPILDLASDLQVVSLHVEKGEEEWLVKDEDQPRDGCYRFTRAEIEQMSYEAGFLQKESEQIDADIVLVQAMK